MLERPLALAFALCASCSSPMVGRELANQTGKADAAGMIVDLDGDQAQQLYLVCEESAGCDIEIELRLVSPDLCAFFPQEPGCGIATGPLSAPVASITLRSPSGDEQARTLLVESANGIDYDLVVGGTTAPRLSIDGGAPGVYELTLRKAASAPALRLGVAAQWWASDGADADAGPEIDAGGAGDAGGGIITGGPCLSGNAGATAYRVRWIDAGGTAQVVYETNGLPDKSRDHTAPFPAWQPFEDPFLGEGGLPLTSLNFVDIEISTAGVTQIDSATLSIYGRSFHTTASGSFNWQTFSGVGAAPINLVSNVPPYAWYSADMTDEIDPGDDGVRIRIRSGLASNSLVVNGIEICMQAQ